MQMAPVIIKSILEPAFLRGNVGKTVLQRGGKREEIVRRPGTNLEQTHRPFRTYVAHGGSTKRSSIKSSSLEKGYMKLED
jgi:hypothetical protein